MLGASSLNIRALCAFIVVWASLALAPYAHANTPEGPAIEEQAAEQGDVKREATLNTPAEQISGDISPETTETRTVIASLETDFTVTLEGKTLDNVKVHRNLGGGILLNPEPIFGALNNSFDLTEEGVLTITRSQDGAVMSLDTATGIVSANGKELGKLQTYGEILEGEIFLTPNAIAVLSGAVPKAGDNDKSIAFELDPRLKVATGFEVFVNDIPLGNIEPAPRAVGSVLLMPLLPVANELGHDVQIIEGGSKVVVRRAQDSAKFTLNLDTGLIELNDRPFGVSQDVTYIDPSNLLLPLSAFETLTGTHVEVEGGTGRILVTLDTRLSGAIEPGERVNDVTKGHPFTAERLDFHIGTDTLNTVNAQFSVRNFNGRVRYETPDLPVNAAELEPAWLSVDYQTTGGAKGSIGDYAADFRELDGVGIRRIRGASYVTTGKKGRLAAAIGAPVSGSRQISDDQYRLDFDGVAAGLRWADVDGWEAGVSYKSDGVSDDQVAVLSAISGRLGRKLPTVDKPRPMTWDARADLGYFNGEARESTIDVSVSGAARYKVNKAISVDVSASYIGAEFLRSDLEAEDRRIALDPTAGEETDTGALLEDLRKRGQDIAAVGMTTQIVARKNIGPLSNPAVSLRAQLTETGLSKGIETGVTRKNYGVAVNTSLANSGVNLGADYTRYSSAQRSPDGPDTIETGEQITVRGHKDFKHFTVRGNYISTQRDDEDRNEQLAAVVTARPIRFALPKEASISVSPSVSALYTNGQTQARAGVVANASSGDLFGPKTHAEASLGVLQPVAGQGDQKTDTFLTLSVGRRLKLGKNLELGLSYRNDLRGNQRLGVFLDGRFGFNEARKFKKTQDGRGVLKGRVFYDKNRNGVMDDDESGIGGAHVRIQGSRLMLSTDVNGFYTIQNIKAGIHTVSVDGASLPLGFSVSEDVTTRASIHEGRITDVSVPIVQRGQIRGFAFIDKNEDGLHQKPETRLEGAKIRLTSVDDPEDTYLVTSASFGQYAFDDLTAGRYWLEILKTNRKDTEPKERVEVVLQNDENGNLMLKTNVVALSRKPTLLAEGQHETEVEVEPGDIDQKNAAVTPATTASP